ncbi:MAG: DegT/DnrJ/EryC1/StrS family aminotransferase, partial [Methyloligellaceae bacterium]
DLHGALPDPDVFDDIRLDTPNYSGRMDNLRAALLRAQLPLLEENVRRWNIRYRILNDGFRTIPGLCVRERPQHEEFVGSSIQFRADVLGAERIPNFIDKCAARGIDVKWFGAAEPAAFTSRYDSWRYLGETQPLPQTLRILSTTCDMRVPLTFSEADCSEITEIVAEEISAGRQ